MTTFIGHYTLTLVVLSVVIAVLAAVAALDLASRVSAASGRFRALWPVGGACAMGLGIWSMHYTGMLAFDLPIIAQRAPDLVITDIFMPGQDGIETLLELRKAFPTLKVIAMSGGTGGGLLNLLHDAELLGADRTIPKPFAPRELIAAVNELLGDRPTPSP